MSFGVPLTLGSGFGIRIKMEKIRVQDLDLPNNSCGSETLMVGFKTTGSERVENSPGVLVHMYQVSLLPQARESACTTKFKFPFRKKNFCCLIWCKILCSKRSLKIIYVLNFAKCGSGSLYFSFADRVLWLYFLYLYNDVRYANLAYIFIYKVICVCVSLESLSTGRIGGQS